MTDPKPLSEEEIQEYDDPAAYDPERLFATVLHYRELIAWLVKYFSLRESLRGRACLTADGLVKEQQNATEILAIVAGLEQKQ